MSKLQSPSVSWERESLRETIVPVTTAQLDWMFNRPASWTPALGSDRQAGSLLAESPVGTSPRPRARAATRDTGASHRRRPRLHAPAKASAPDSALKRGLAGGFVDSRDPPRSLHQSERMYGQADTNSQLSFSHGRGGGGMVSPAWRSFGCLTATAHTVVKHPFVSSPSYSSSSTTAFQSSVKVPSGSRMAMASGSSMWTPHARSVAMLAP